ncbi:UNVERIFIED_CONTAM: hypothetical protein RMT77_003040 [Armadillidium vulgare]
MKVTGGLFILLVILSVSFGTENGSPPDREGKFFKKYVGYYSKTTLLSVITRTKTAIYTCISATTTLAACSGRRRRALFEDLDLKSENLEDIDSSSLDSSKNDGVVKVPVEIVDREGRKITVMKSLYSTLEVHTTVFNTGTTLTASAICNIVNGQTVGNSCFG